MGVQTVPSHACGISAWDRVHRLAIAMGSTRVGSAGPAAQHTGPVLVTVSTQLVVVGGRRAGWNSAARWAKLRCHGRSQGMSDRRSFFFVRAPADRAPFSSQFIQDGVEELLTQSFHINVAPMATTNDLSFSSSRRPSLSGETHNPRRVNSDSIVPQSLGAGPR